jgi:hypothetical protein
VLEGTENRRITCLLPEGDSLWYGTLEGGLHLYRNRTGKDVVTGLTGKGRIVGIGGTSGGAGKLFVATKQSGCYVVDRRTLEAEGLDIPGYVLPGRAGDYENHLMAMREIDGRVWLGTREAG